MKRAGFKGRLPRIIACGSRSAAFDDFTTALSTAREGDIVILLVDSETPLRIDPATAQPVNPWKHLLNQDHWTKPAAAKDEHAYLMVVCMESWFLADVNALKSYFGPGFKEDKIKANPMIEQIPKDSVFKQLADATAESIHKGKYDGRSKARHSFEILGRLDPAKVRIASPHADRFFRFLDATLR